MKKALSAFSILAAGLALLGSSAAAHVVVKPGEVKTGAFQTFTVGVPNEKGGNVVEVKLVIPDGLSSVRPNVKPGWEIDIEKEGQADGEKTAKVKSITWRGGTIGENLRDEFLFSAKTPDEPTELRWKAYETYDSGLTVAWDLTAEQQPKKPDGSPDFSKSGPFSITSVVDEEADVAAASRGSSDSLARVISGAALIAALVAFGLSLRKKA